MSLSFFVVGFRFAVLEYLGFEKLVVCGSCGFARSGSLRMELQGMLEALQCFVDLGKSVFKCDRESCAI